MTATTVDSCSTTNPPARPIVMREPAAGWAARLVTEDARAGYSDLASRAAAGLGLSAFYGLALGARQGGKALAIHTLGVPLGLLLVVLAGAPSLFVFLSLCRAPIDARADVGVVFVARNEGEDGDEAIELVNAR